jgi:hypothetical protein
LKLLAPFTAASLAAGGIAPLSKPPLRKMKDQTGSLSEKLMPHKGHFALKTVSIMHPLLSILNTSHISLLNLYVISLPLDLPELGSGHEGEQLKIHLK